MAGEDYDKIRPEFVTSQTLINLIKKSLEHPFKGEGTERCRINVNYVKNIVFFFFKQSINTF